MTADRWSLWRSQVLAILRLEITKNFLARRGLWIYLLALGPVVLFGGHSLNELQREHACDLPRDNLIFATIFQFFFLRLGVFFGCVGVFINLFRGEMLGKSLHYYLLAPVRREVLLAGKYLAGVITTTVIFSTSVAASLAALYAHFHPSVVAQYMFEGGGIRHVLAYVGITALACIGYGGVLLLMGFLFRNPIIPAAVVLVWESLNPFLPALLKKLSVIFYLQSLLPLQPPVQGDWAFLAILANPTPAYLAIPGLLLVTLGGLVLAARKVRKLEINYGAE
jgi:ABC-type transport system involved in multi-copper enzyme maturation permease subunit